MKLDFNAKHYLTGSTQTKRCLVASRGKYFNRRLTQMYADEKAWPLRGEKQIRKRAISLSTVTKLGLFKT